MNFRFYNCYEKNEVKTIVYNCYYYFYLLEQLFHFGDQIDLGLWRYQGTPLDRIENL